MTIRCICVDDEEFARKGIELALKPFPEFELIQSYKSAEELLSNIPEKIDVMFVDIEMPRINGFELLEKWPLALPLVVFVTAYNQYAIKAFEAQALDYILKPIEDDRFEQVVARIKEQLTSSKTVDRTKHLVKVINGLKSQLNKQASTISVKTDEGYFRLKVNSISYLEAVGDHVCIHTNDKEYIVRNRLKNYVVELAKYNFFQIHRSTIVNAKYVNKVTRLKFGGYLLSLINENELKASRGFSSEIKKLLAQLDT